MDIRKKRKLKNRNKKIMVNVSRRNWDNDFYYDLLTGNGFKIIEPADVSLNGTKEKTLYGPRSPLYGTDYEDEKAFIERYRCKCGEFKSRLFEGEICPICHTAVEYRDVDISMTGWIDLGEGNRVINPLYYQILSASIGKKIFRDILISKYKVTKDGKQEKATEEDLDIPPTSIYFGIGMDAFYNRYEEILNYFKARKKGKEHRFDTLIAQKDRVFVTKIPIYSTKLRPESVTFDSFYFESSGKIINSLYPLSETIKNCETIERDYLLQRIQKKLNDLWEYNFELLNGKDGYIRDQLLGCTLNFTARNVIIPDSSLKINEVDLSYHTFLELFKYLIIADIMKLEDVTLSKAHSIWKLACSKFDESVYECMLHLVHTKKLKVLINRNPTLNFYSVLLMNIRTVKKDFSDYTLSLPIPILPGLNADFDGDILNIIGFMDRKIAAMFKEQDPAKNMIIAPDTGVINPLVTITKVDLINCYTFLNYERSKNDRPERYPGESGYMDIVTGEVTP